MEVKDHGIYIPSQYACCESKTAATALEWMEWSLPSQWRNFGLTSFFLGWLIFISTRLPLSNSQELPFYP